MQFKRAALAIITTTLSCVGVAACALAEVPESATLYSKQGTVEFRAPEQAAWQAAAVGQDLPGGATVRTGETSRAGILIAGGILVRLNQNSRFGISQASSQSDSALTVDQGDAYFFSRNSKEFPRIRTSQVSAAIRGTEFTVHADVMRSVISVISGSVSASNQLGAVTLAAGEESVIETGKAPRKALLVDPHKLVQWALYYPAPVTAADLSDLSVHEHTSATHKLGLQQLARFDLSAAAAAFQGATKRDLLAQALIAKYRGHTQSALRILSSTTLSDSVSAALLRSSLLLESGQSAEAQAIHRMIESSVVTASASSPENLRLLRIQEGMIALSQNHIEEARAKTAEALATRSGSNLESSSAYLARSYVLQADSDLPSAGALVDAALASDPTNPALRARRAELSLSDGDSMAALEQSAAALELDPTDSHALSIQGFAQLARGDRSGAMRSFTDAIERSAGDGLPFLGRGLALIRSGDLAGGRLAIQQAVHNEPSRALYRSYLGKALFEQDQNELADEEYSRAMQLDPNDPTPYLYRSYQRSSENRPVEALADIEKSIDLNDNRSVYRSQLLLDQDNSVRSSSLAQLYGQLGFEQVSRIEAIKSLSKDYGNYSAHLLLAQSYDTVEALTQGSISETFIARLMSPVNFNLVRPNGAGTVSANEYTALFDRDLTRTSVGIDANSRNAEVGPQMQVAGTQGRWGYSMRYGYTYADGYRARDYQNEHALFGSLQYQLSPETTLLFDTNFETLDNGDEALGFDPRANDAGQNLSLNDYFARVGFNHNFDAHSQIIGQVVTNNSRLGLANEPLTRGFFVSPTRNGELLETNSLVAQVDQRIRFASHGIRGDLQHIANGALLSNILGSGVLTSQQELTDSGEFRPEERFFGSSVSSRAENTESSVRLFNYSTFHVAPQLDLQAGVSFSRLHLSSAPLAPPFSDAIIVMTRWDPKVGLVYSPTADTTIRSAFFETVGNAGIRELELIEPTVLSGFNQTFFDIFPGTRSRNFALGLDQKLSSGTYLGLEVQHRDIQKRTPLVVSSLLTDADSERLLEEQLFFQEGQTFMDDNVGKAYAYQVISDRVTATIDYLWSQIRDHSDASDVLTNRVQIGSQYTSPSGFLALVRGTWRGQDLSGFNQVEEVSDKDDFRSFWILDAGVGYRIPHRRGQLNLTFTNIFDRYFKYIPNGLEPELLPGAGVMLSFNCNF